MIERGDREAFVLVPAREEQRELVASQAEGLATLTQAGRHLRQDLVTGRMPVPVVDLLEVVDVEQDEGQREALLLSLVQVVLEPLVEVPVVAEPCERVGERQAHRLQRAVHRALVERDGDERADEGRGEERRPLPEDGQHEADRGHDREGNDRPVDGVLQERQEGLAGPAGDDAGGEQDVDGVERDRRKENLDEESADARIGADEDGRCACRAAGERVDRAVVGEPDRGPPLNELDRRPRDEADHDRGRPAVDDGGADDEDRGQRDAAGGDPLDRHRVGLDEGRRHGEREHAAYDAERRLGHAEGDSGGDERRDGREGDRDQKRKKPGSLP